MKRLLLALTLVACDRQPAPPATPPADSTEQPAALSPQDSVLGRWRAKVPDSVFVRRGACPFECCVYSEWALRDSAAIHTEPRVGAPSVFVLPDSTRFRADSGFVRVTKLQLVIVGDTVDQRPYAKLFLPGDTLVILDHRGEGHWNVFSDGRVIEVEGFWGAEQPRPVAEMLGQYDREWWVHITLQDGRQGWLLVMPPMQLIGADNCGTPPYWQKN